MPLDAELIGLAGSVRLEFDSLNELCEWAARGGMYLEVGMNLLC